MTIYFAFTSAIFLVIWAYLGYFVLLKILSYMIQKNVNKKEFFPFVSVIITAYNEEKRIQQKLDSTLRTVYPKDKMEIIVASDGSTDKTDEIVKSYQNKGVILISFPERHGKHFCQGKAVEKSSGEIIILSDATTFLKENAISIIVSNFADPKIGVVSGTDIIANENNESQGEGLYVRYEMVLRALESKVGSLIGASGSFYATRHSLCAEWHDDMSSDFYLPIVAYKNGYRTVSDDDAIGYYNIIEDDKKEFKRKVRTVVHGIDVLMHFKYILNPLKYGFYSIQMLSHKLARWLVPFALIVAFIANTYLLHRGSIYRAIFLCQIIFYGIAFLAFAIKRLRENKLFKIPYFFVMANYSILVAWFEYFKGERYITWQSTKR